MWADQCASVIYRHGGVGGKVGNGGDLYPLLFHEKGIERATQRFQSAPGVGQVRFMGRIIQSEFNDSEILMVIQVMFSNNLAECNSF